MTKSKLKDPKTIKVHILDEAYQVNCSLDEVAALKKSAIYLDEKMQEMKGGSSALKLNRLTVMAALNITNDLLATEAEKKEQLATQDEEISSLLNKLGTALNRLYAKQAES